MKLIFLSFGLLTGLAAAGTIEGQVELPPDRGSHRIAMERYTGAISGKVEPPPPRKAGVWLTAPGLAAPRPGNVVLFSQKGYQFEKSMLVVARGTTVKFPNADPDYHNVFSLSRPKRFDLGRYKTGENPAPEVTFDKEGVISLRCEIHEHMRALVIVVDSPYFTTTDAAGKFSLKGVVAGEYTLHGRLDKRTAWRTEIVVPDQGTLTIDLPAE